MKLKKDIGRFTLSLDCEGLWGMADLPNVLNGGLINSQSLDFAYDVIHSTLDKEGIQSTCAFVTAFALDEKSLCDSLPFFKDIAKYKPEWFYEILPRLRSGGNALDGFIGDTYWRRLKDAGHEIAWHGTTHMPLNNNTCEEAVKLELSFAEHLFRHLGHKPKSIIFPRNLIGNLELLHDFGFNAYRAARKRSRARNILNVISEYNLMDRKVHDLPMIQDGWHVSPAGYFLNWPSGVRSLIPVSVTIKRWKSLLHSAAENGGYVHMWFHPHNLITAPSMQIAFREIMGEVGKLVRQGDLECVTMEKAEYLYGIGAGL